jgi:hypothetical protein
MSNSENISISYVTHSPDTTIQASVLNNQNGIKFQVTNHWDFNKVMLYDEGWESPPFLDRVIYHDKAGRHELIFDPADPKDWNVWQKRYQEIRQELAEKNLPSGLNKDGPKETKALSEFTRRDWFWVVGFIFAGLLFGLCYSSPRRCQ